MPITPEQLKSIIDSVSAQKRIKLILDINSNYIRNKVDNSVESFSHGDAALDGQLIADVILAQHGLGADRFAKLNKVQRDYVSSLVASILEHMCDHLEKITLFIDSNND